MSNKPKKVTPIELLLSDPSVPLSHKKQFVGKLFSDEENGDATLSSIFATLGEQNAPSVYEKKVKELAAIIEMIGCGPLRSAAFVEMMPGAGAQAARVVMDDGQTVASTVPDAKTAQALRRGDRVLLDGKQLAILYRFAGGQDTGEVVTYERKVDERRIEVSNRQGEKLIIYTASDLADAMAEHKPGCMLIANTRHAMAYAAIAEADGLAHYRYLTREKVPDVDVDRDIGSPPDCIADTLEHMRIELTMPEVSRKYGIRRSQMRLLAGVSGSGKTLAIQAIHNGAYQLMSEVSGLCLHELPPRVFRLRMSDVLNYLLGESDKQLARFFKEVEQLADEPVDTPNGKMILPVIAIMEEIDGLARSRGHGDPIYDRILTTALQWLDSTRPELKEKFIIYIGTTNEPHHVDRAFLRRIGGNIDHFHRLKREGFAQVLDKHLRKVPVAEKGLDCAITNWIFEEKAPVVEVQFNGAHPAVRRYRRDLLTGALVDRAVQDAAKMARRDNLRLKTESGIDIDHLESGFTRQFNAIIEQLDESNAGQYMDLPDGARVASLRRVSSQPMPQSGDLTEYKK